MIDPWRARVRVKRCEFSAVRGSLWCPGCALRIQAAGLPDTGMRCPRRPLAAVALHEKPEEYARNTAQSDVAPDMRQAWRMAQDQQKRRNMNDYLDLEGRQAVHFGPYRVHPQQRLVLEAGRPLRLGRRALDILLVLLGQAGQVVSKQQLIAHVWPTSVVEESNLRVHIAALRKALGDGQNGQRYIVTVAQRGYSFVAPLSFEPLACDSSQPSPEVFAHNLPLRRTRMIGRQALVDSLVSQLPQTRFITLVGSGGIGKTTVALRVAELLIGRYRDGICLLDLAPLNDPAMITANLAALLELVPDEQHPMASLARQLKERRMLLLIDNCEHLPDTVALLCETLLRGAPHLHILTTSRESLRAEGEYVQRLEPLASPPREALPERTTALTYPALQLLIERAMSGHDSFELSDHELPLAIDICQRLDGIPLALELAAAQVGRFGLTGLLAQLQDRFRLLVSEPGTALPRQQTLRATLDWSFTLLTTCEQTALRRLGVMCGAFSLESAAAVIVGRQIEAEKVLESVTQLVAKSLLSVEAGDDEVSYRLLDTTRAYALEKLEDAGELSATRERHAQRCLTLMHQARHDWEQVATAFWLDRYTRHREDIRAALDWGLGPQGTQSLAIQLTASAMPLWQELSLLKEHGLYVNKALALLKADPHACPHLSIDLQLALGSFNYHTQGGTPATIGAFASALQLAEHCQDVTGQLRAVSGQMAVNLSRGDYRQAQQQSLHFDRLGLSPDPVLELSTQRLRVLAQHFSGDQQLARHNAEQVLQRMAQSGHLNRFTHGFGVQYEQNVASLTLLARILWLQGFPEQARRTADLALDIALQVNHGTSICYTLALAGVVIAHYNGDTATACARIQLLQQQAHKHSVTLFHDWAVQYAQAIGEPRDPATAAVPAEHQGLIRDILITLCAQNVDETAMRRAQSGAAGWSSAEILRAGAECLLKREPPGSNAETVLLKALQLARQHGALAWELRSASSLARLWQHHGHYLKARDVLEPVYLRFTEGFETPDLRNVRQLLEELQQQLAA